MLYGPIFIHTLFTIESNERESLFYTACYCVFFLLENYSLFSLHLVSPYPFPLFQSYDFDSLYGNIQLTAHTTNKLTKIGVKIYNNSGTSFQLIDDEHFIQAKIFSAGTT